VREERERERVREWGWREREREKRLTRERGLSGAERERGALRLKRREEERVFFVSFATTTKTVFCFLLSQMMMLFDSVSLKLTKEKGKKRTTRTISLATIFL